MACTRPITAWRSKLGKNKKNGSWPIVFNKSEGYIDKELTLPCGKCIECKLERSRQWAARCELEAQTNKENCFLTLTYNNENLPKDNSISKKEVQKFIKRLRKKINKKVKYFACGEYGEKLSRPHYHICLFGYDFQDKYKMKTDNRFKSPFSTYKGDTQLYRSETLEKIWKKGYASIGKLTYESAAYVARYVTKKIGGEKAEQYYKNKQPEFALMSKKPGIGYEWYKKFKNDVISTDKVIIRKGLTVKVPRYYDKYIQEEDPDDFMKRKAERRKKIEEKDYEELNRLDKVSIIKQKKRIRSLEK